MNADANKKDMKLQRKKTIEMKPNRDTLELAYTTMDAFVELDRKKKSKGPEEQDNSTLGLPSSSMKRLFNKMPAEGLIGEADKKQKEVVVLSNKTVAESAEDISTSEQKMLVIMKDLLSVLKNDSRLSHRPIVYQLQNKAK